MLELKNIKKSYKTGDFVQHALKGINLKFDSNEFVCVLGQSGSGKTTLLNIIGGLDRYDNGDLVINDKSTKKFNDILWDAYRNNCIGFIFQSYNLIGHLNVLENVELALTLSGVTSNNRKKRAIEVLERVGLKEHIYKKPNQLSGGQMQRVAIARALVNNPQVILADEPTGALDSKTSEQIMNLIKEISHEKLVIMVTHNPELAEKYASRIIELKDGEVISDSNKKDNFINKNEIKIKKTKMSFITALKLSFNNIKTKKGRTLLTAFASSIGIIGISLILSLSNGFDIQIDKYEKNTLSSFPVMISASSINMNEEQLSMFQNNFKNSDSDFTDKKVIYPFDLSKFNLIHNNKLSKEYINYVEDIDTSLISGISYTRVTNLNLLIKNNDKIKPVSVNELHLSVVPKELEEDTFMESAFDLLYGKLNKNIDELVLVIDSKNRVDASLLELLDLDSSLEEINFESIIGKEIKLVFNNDYYTEYNNMFIPNMDYENLYNNKNNITLKIVGIVRAKKDNYLASIATNMSSMSTMATTNSTMKDSMVGNLLYKNELINKVIDNNSSSNIVYKQINSESNLLTGEALTNESKNYLLYYLGSEDYPFIINIYPKDFNSKDQIIEYLDDYNKGLSDEEKIVYTDLASTITDLSSGIMDAVTIVLVAFSAVSLVVSSIMIGIITYISVLERTKEIGVLRSIGARKRDISRVFNAETFIIGISSGLLGILIARLMIIPVNVILLNLTNIENIAVLSINHAILLIVISTTLTLIGGSIPSRMASKKDPVVALRSE